VPRIGSFVSPEQREEWRTLLGQSRKVGSEVRSVTRATNRPYAFALVFVVVVASLSATESRPRVAQRSEWDPRIEPIAQSVERLRGLEFRRPVPVAFQDDAAFDRGLRVATRSTTKAERATEIAELEELRAFELIPANTSLDDIVDAPSTTDILAYFDPFEKRITVRGTTLDAAHKVTVAHELTHALDDQHFDLRRFERSSRTSSANLREDLVEGDAERVATLYRQQLTGEERAAIDLEERAQASEPGSSGRVGTPEILDVLTVAPYLLGRPMVETVALTKGTTGVDAVFRKPPVNDETAFDVIDARKPLPPVQVATPRLRAGEQRAGPTDELGPFFLYVVLASRISPVSALDAADGWAGDAATTFRAHGTRCVRVAIAGRTRADTRAIAHALESYAITLPFGAADVSTHGRTAGVTVCDRKERTAAPMAYAVRALRLLTLRNRAVAAAFDSGWRAENAACISSTLVHDSFVRSYIDLGQPSASQSEAFFTRYGSIVQDCASSIP